jgi:hypothetical protein
VDNFLRKTTEDLNQTDLVFVLDSVFRLNFSKSGLFG